jgi:hypothetical protein
MPTHEIEGSDYVTISGHRAYKDTDPATQLIQADMNSIWRGLMNIYLLSGKTLLANGAADQAAGWVGLLAAFQRLDAHWTSGGVQMSASTHTLSPSADVSCFQILDDTSGPFVNGIVQISQANSGGQDVGRFLLIENGSASRKYISGISPYSSGVWLAPGASVLFYGALQSGLKWQPVGAPVAGTLPIEWRGSVDGLLRTGNLYWQISGRKVTMDIPSLTGVTLSGAQGLSISAVSNAALPSFLDAFDPTVGTWAPLCAVEDNGTWQPGYFWFNGAAGSRKLNLAKIDGGISFSGNVQFQGAHLNYLLA